MFQDSKPTLISPSKGKAREKTHWQTGWWDFQPLAEHPQKPVEWSPSSVIFTAHHTQPLVTARHFSSSKHFGIPSPVPIVSSPTSYEPPSVISVASDDEWLFAYFPRRDGDGIGCLWKRGAQIDSWTVKEWWSFAHGAGVVAASWLGEGREWSTDHSGITTRLPPRGPRTPISNPTILLVTQDHHVNVCYFRHQTTIFKIIGCSLRQPGKTLESQSRLGEENDHTNRRCFRATIGLNHDETSIMIATRSSFSPPPLTDLEPQFNSTDITFAMDVPQQPSLEIQSMEWESWCEESTINLCEIHLKFDGAQMSLTASPLPPILNPGVGLIALGFICIPPFSTTPIAALPPKPNGERGLFYLAATYLDFGNYTSTPLSELTIYTISRQPSVTHNSLNKPSWAYHRNATREFSPAILTFVTSSAMLSDASGALILAGIANTSGALLQPSSNSKETSVGIIKVLNMSDLSDNHDWETLPMMSKLGDVGQTVPINAVVSPSGTLLCAVSSSLRPAKTSIYLLPRRKNVVQSPGTSIPPLAPALAAAIVSRRTAADITHLLSLPSTPINEAIDTLYHTIRILDGHKNGPSQSSTWGVIGEALVIYRTRSLQATKEHDCELLTARWKFAHDMCSLAACNRAFESCRKEDGYDLEAVWQLIGLSSWVVSFTEGLMKQCVLSCDVYKGTLESGKDVVSASTLESPILLHLSHPLALLQFSSTLVQMNQFRGYLGSLSARGENAQIARDVLIDLVDNSGIDFVALVPLLAECFRESQVLDRDDCRRGLASCQATPTMHPHLTKVINKLTHSTVLNKSTLFIKPFDLVDGVGRLSVSPKKDQDKDVVSKCILIGAPIVTCLHCAGLSDVGKDSGRDSNAPIRWRLWEKIWAQHCVCGGPWASDTNLLPL